MTERTINISGKDVKFRSSAAVPRLYRLRFGRDIFRDLNRLERSFGASKKQRKKSGRSTLDVGDLEVFENVAYIMAWHADPSIPDSIDDWLEEFEMFSIYEVLPQILEMWNFNMATDVVPKKKSAHRTGS